MVVTTFSGIVVSGTGFPVLTTGTFPLVSFDTASDMMTFVEKEANFHTEVTILSPDIFFAGGMSQAIMLDSRNTVDQVEKEGNFHREITFINPRFDFSFAPLTTASGITVINFGFNTVGGFIAVPRVNRRIFPTDPTDATLFPGDKPRGTPLN